MPTEAKRRQLEQEELDAMFANDDVMNVQEYADPSAHRNALLGNIGISGLLGSAQALTEIIPTSEEKYKNARLADIEMLGPGQLTAERQAGVTAMERSMMDPVRAFAAEERKRLDATQAAQGGTTSAAAAVRAQREEGRRVDDNALRAGYAISQERIDMAKDQLQELKELRVEKGARQRELLRAGGKTLTAVAGQAGQLAAARSETAEPDWAAFQKKYGKSDSEMTDIQALYKEDPDAVSSMLHGGGQ